MPAVPLLKEVYADVESKLRSCAYCDMSGAIHLLQYLVLPSFGNPYAWDVFRFSNRHANEWRITHTEWKAEDDIPMLMHPVDQLKCVCGFQPRIEAKQYKTDAAKLQEIFENLASASICLRPESNMLCFDGVNYELMIGDIRPSCRIFWHSQLPREWGSLAPILHSVLAYFECLSEECSQDWNLTGYAG